MLLGFYEKEVLEQLQQDQESYNLFIDIGAADGYYAAGMSLKLGIPSIAYEANESGRNSIRKITVSNGLAEKIEVRETFGNESFKELMIDIEGRNNPRNRPLLLFDIEGSEFDLLTTENLEYLYDAFLLIEVHQWGEYELKEAKKLFERLNLNHSVTVLTTGSRNPAIYANLEILDDVDRWLLCAEGRDRVGVWYYCRPKSFE